MCINLGFHVVKFTLNSHPTHPFIFYLHNNIRYEPPPFGPGTSLNRTSYGVGEMKPGFIQALSRRPQGMVIAGACTAFVAIAYIPISEFLFIRGCDDVQKNRWVLLD